MLWQPSSGVVHAILPHASSSGAAFANDAVYTYGEDNHVRMWDRATGAQRADIAVSDGVEFAATTSDGVLVFGDLAGNVYAWDGKASAARTLVRHKGKVNKVVASPDGLLIASGADDSDVFVIDPAHGSHVTLPGHDGTATGIAFAADGKTLATGDVHGHIRVWTTEGALLRTMAAGTSGVLAIAIARDGRLVSASADGAVRLWSAEGKQLVEMRGHTMVVTQIAIDRAQTHILTTSTDSTARIWNLSDGSLASTLSHSAAVYDGLFSDDGAFAVTTGEDSIVRVWDVASGTELERLEGHTGPGWLVAIDPRSGMLLSAGLDDKVILWNTPFNARGTSGPTAAN